MVKLGIIYIDDSKIQANASRHNAVSYEYVKRLEEQLEGEIDKLLNLTNTQNDKQKNQQPAISEKLKRWKERLEKTKLATEVVEARATIFLFCNEASRAISLSTFVMAVNPVLRHFYMPANPFPLLPVPV